MAFSLKRSNKVVALGGGHGLASSLKALTKINCDITAVVGVSDDGGSSGRLRKEFGIVPPGDLRMALAALCGDDDWGSTWANVLQHRFASKGELDGHSLGNLIITALWEETGDIVSGLDWVGKLLGAQGRVLPLCLEPLSISAQVQAKDRTVRKVTGQVRVAKTKDTIKSIALSPQNPTVCPEAIDAVLNAKSVILGPGSWYTSVLTHFEVPEMKDALINTRANRILVLNLKPQLGETTNFSPERYLEVLSKQNPLFTLDVVIADPRHVANEKKLRTVAAKLGAQVELAEVGNNEAPTEQHNPDLLASTFEKVL